MDTDYLTGGLPPEAGAAGAGVINYSGPATVHTAVTSFSSLRAVC